MTTGLPDLPCGLRARHPSTADHARIVAAIPSWWADSRSPADAERLSALVQPLFLEHFVDTCLVAEREGGALGAFLVAFLSQAKPAEAYIHFVGVHPDFRGRGIGAACYQWFFEVAAARGRTSVGAVTGHANHGSVRFHRALGFDVDTGGDKVHFRKAV